MIRPATRFGAVACVAALVLAACSTSEQTRPAEVPKSGGTFVAAVVRPASLDPALANTLSERIIADQLYDGLTSWNPRNLTTAAGIADRWESSDDRRQWTFHLRDVQAGNGERVNAGDVKATMQRIARKSGGSPSTDLLAPVAGFKEFSTNDAVPELTGVVIVDDKTVRFDLDQPFAELPKLLGNPTFGIVHKDAQGNTVSTGPMAVADGTDPNTLRLKKAPGSKAYVDGAEIRYFNDVATAYSTFEKGEANWSPVPADKADEAAQRYGRQLYRQSLRTLFLAFNLEDPNLSNVKFREAIVRAIDRNAVEAKLGVVGTSVLNGVVPDGVPGSQSGGCGQRCTFNEDVARNLVKEVFPNGAPPIRLDVAAGPPLVDPAARRIVDDLAKVGITANLVPTPAEQYSNRTVAPDRQLFQASWSAAYPSPDAFISPLFYAPSISNVAVLKDQKIDEAIAKAQSEGDTETRNRLFQDAERRVMDQMPLVPLAQFPLASVESSTTRGVDPLPTGNFDISTVWLTNAPQG